MSPRSSACLLSVSTLLGFAASAHAVAWGTSAVSVPLGRGLAAHRAPALCPHGLYVRPTALAWRYRLPGCYAWTTQGFTMPPPTQYQRVNMFAAAQGGRIVAATDRGVLYTDDLGEHWAQAAWDGAQSPLSVTFDGETGFAAGTGGTLWMSRDRGATWRVRRDGESGDLIDVVSVGTLVAYSNDRGAVRFSTDAGWTVRTVSDRAERAMPVMVAHEGALWVRTEGRRWWRAQRDGSLDEDARPSWESEAASL